MSRERVTERPPSPPHSTDGHFHPGDDSRSFAGKPQIFTPPMPARSEFAPHHEFDAYGDPSLYHTAPAPVYYPQQRSMITSMPAQHSPPHAMADRRLQSRAARALGTPSSPGTESTGHSPSPVPRSRKAKKKPYKNGSVIITQPLSILTQDYTTPVRDMLSWVNRSVEERMAEVERKKGYISRPMNSFMLYRSAYAERVKLFCKENNHQLVSKVTGASWPLEPKEVRETYERYAIIERDNHQAAHPQYKFTPNKPTKRPRQRDDSDSDSDWEGSSKGSRRARSTRRRFESRSASSTPFEERPIRHHHAMPALNLSGYEISNPYGAAPLMVGPNGMIGEYYQVSTLAGPYGDHQVSDVKFERVEQAFPHYQTATGLVGMPHASHHELLTSHPAPEPVGTLVQHDMLDPRLGQSDPNFHFGYYPGNPDSAQDVPSSTTYEQVSQMRVGYQQQQEAFHPGFTTLTQEHNVWDDPGRAGSDFDSEFQRLS